MNFFRLKHLKLLAILFIIFNSIIFVQKTISISWQYLVPKKIGSHNLYAESLFFDDNDIFFSDQINTIFSVNQKNGKTNWSFISDSYTPFEILIERNSIYLANFDAHIYRLDKNNGKALWAYSIPEGYIPDTKIFSLEEDNYLFFADRGGVLRALDKETGNLIWERSFKKIDSSKKFNYGDIHFGFCKEDKEYLFINNFPEKKLFVVEKKSGDIKLEIPWIGQEPLIYNLQLNYLIVEDRDSTKISFYDLDQNLEEVCTFYIGEGLVSNLFINENKKELFFQSENSIYLNSIEEGNTIWHHQAREGERTFDFVEDLGIVLSQISDPLNFQSYLKASYWDTGEEMWQFILPTDIETYFIFNETMVFAGPDQKLFFLDLKSGEIKSDYDLKGRIKKFFLYDLKKSYLLVLSQTEDNKMVLNCFNSKQEHLWTYNGEIDLSKEEFQAYQHKDRLFYLNDERFLIESIKVDAKGPVINELKTVNFKKFIDLEYRLSQKIDFQPKGSSKIFDFIREFIQNKIFLLKNLSIVDDVLIESEINDLENLEITVNLNQNFYSNFNQQVKIRADLYFNGEKVSTNNAFYYDFNTWKIRFKLDEPGTYSWKLKIKTSYFTKIEESIEIVENISQKKNLTVRDKQFFLDNQLFWPLGLEDWMNDQNYDGNWFNDFGFANKLKPEIEEEEFSYISFADYLDIYKEEANFNIFRFGTGNAKPSLWRSFDDNHFLPDIRNALIGDNLTETVREKNYRLMFTIFDFDPPFTENKFFKEKSKKIAIEQYLDYIIARYSSRVDIWEIANETSPSLDWLNFVSDYLLENDPYHHPITTNWPQEDLNNSDLLSIHWYSPIAENNLSLERDSYWVQKRYENSSKAKIISELGFKDSSFFEGSSDQIRKMIWLNVFHLSGSILWNQPLSINLNEDNANVFLGPNERAELKVLVEFLPLDTFPFKESFLSLEGSHIYFLKNEDYLLSYILNLYTNKQENLKLDIELQKDGKIEWIDPRSGSILEESFASQGSNILNMPTFFDDLALKITYF